MDHLVDWHADWNGVETNGPETSGACAACGLTAQLRGELHRARTELDAAEFRFAAAIDRSLTDARAAFPRDLAREVGTGRRQTAALEALLAELTACHGGYDAVCA